MGLKAEPNGAGSSPTTMGLACVPNSGAMMDSRTTTQAIHTAKWGLKLHHIKLVESIMLARDFLLKVSCSLSVKEVVLTRTSKRGEIKYV